MFSLIELDTVRYIFTFKMTSRIQGWSNRQKDTGWGYAFAHYIPGVSIYYSITRRTITNYICLYGSKVLIELIVVFLLEPKFYAPRLFYYPPVEEDTLITIVLLQILLSPLLMKLAISEARKDGKKRLNQIKEEVEQLKEET